MKQGVRPVTPQRAEACSERRGQQRRQGSEDGMNAGNKGLRPEQLSRGQQISQMVQAALRILLGAFLVFTGTSHLTVARA